MATTPQTFRAVFKFQDIKDAIDELAKDKTWHPDEFVEVEISHLKGERAEKNDKGELTGVQLEPKYMMLLVRKPLDKRHIPGWAVMSSQRR